MGRNKSMGLLDTYEEMKKQSALQQLENDRRDILTKYASIAEEMLEKEHGEDYDAADVEKLAEALIQIDVETAEQQEKVAEYDEAGRIMARSFIEELKNNK